MKKLDVSGTVWNKKVTTPITHRERIQVGRELIKLATLYIAEGRTTEGVAILKGELAYLKTTYRIA